MNPHSSFTATFNPRGLKSEVRRITPAPVWLLLRAARTHRGSSNIACWDGPRMPAKPLKRAQGECAKTFSRTIAPGAASMSVTAATSSA